MMMTEFEGGGGGGGGGTGGEIEVVEAEVGSIIEAPS